MVVSGFAPLAISRSREDSARYGVRCGAFS
jgi:hypothetical protein